MATRAQERGASAPLDLSAMLAAIPSLSRPLLSRLTARMIERLDEIDGDPEAEPNGDETDGTNAEDEALCLPRHFVAFGAGCPISDPD